MFGVALEIKIADFSQLLRNPKSAVAGIISQFLLLPFLTFIIILMVNPQPSIALGMMLVAACPGGNISNFMTLLAKGNTALSVSLTAFSSVAAIFLTPLNLEFWANLYGPTNEILKSVNLNAIEVFKTISLILALPLLLGTIMNRWKPMVAKKLSNILKPISIVIFIGFILIAFTNNLNIFIEHIHVVIIIVLFHNGLALTAGYSFGKLLKLDKKNKRTLAIETGIQNSGLGLLLIFTFFNGMGGMALIAAWWGIWHIISGLLLASFWSYRSSLQFTS